MDAIDFNKIPESWALCPYRQCEMAGECLRHQVYLRAPEHVRKWKCVLPKNVGNGQCEFFQKAEKVKMARGLNAIYRDVSNKNVRSSIRLRLTDFLGSKGTYYRYKDGERLMNPQMQQQVCDIVHQFAPKAEVNFDESFAAYDFTL